MNIRTIYFSHDQLGLLKQKKLSRKIRNKDAQLRSAPQGAGGPALAGHIRGLMDELWVNAQHTAAFRQAFRQEDLSNNDAVHLMKHRPTAFPKFYPEKKFPYPGFVCFVKVCMQPHISFSPIVLNNKCFLPFYQREDMALGQQQQSTVNPLDSSPCISNRLMSHTPL